MVHPSRDPSLQAPADYTPRAQPSALRSRCSLSCGLTDPVHEHSGSPAPPVVPFGQRAKKLTVQESLNADLDLSTPSQRAGDRARVMLSSTTDPAKYNYRIAYEKPMERSEGGPLNAREEASPKLTLCRRLQPSTDKLTRQQRPSATTTLLTTLVTQEHNLRCDPHLLSLEA